MTDLQLKLMEMRMTKLLEALIEADTDECVKLALILARATSDPIKAYNIGKYSCYVFNSGSMPGCLLYGREDFTRNRYIPNFNIPVRKRYE